MMLPLNWGNVLRTAWPRGRHQVRFRGGRGLPPPRVCETWNRLQDVPHSFQRGRLPPRVCPSLAELRTWPRSQQIQTLDTESDTLRVPEASVSKKDAEGGSPCGRSTAELWALPARGLLAPAHTELWLHPAPPGAGLPGPQALLCTSGFTWLSFAGDASPGQGASDRGLFRGRRAC